MIALSGALSRISEIGDALKPPTGTKHQDLQRHLEHAVRPLPSSRSRRLTLPFPCNGHGEHGEKLQTTNSQTQSAFFRMLPPEMRMSIYLYYFPRETISIKKDERLRYVNWEPHKWDLLPLLLTCRRAYSEAIDLLYTQPSFHFDNFDTPILFAASILPHRLSVIRSISFAWDCICFWDETIPAPPPFDGYTWSKLWEVIAAMKGLKELHVRIWNPPRMDRMTEMKVFKPLSDITWPDMFELELPWQAVNESHEQAHEGMPYTVKRVQRSYWL